jgi:hypothetical protein
MLSPGEQPRSQPTSLRRVILLLGICLAFAVGLLSQAGNLKEYQRYFTQERRPASLDLLALSEEWTEARLHEHFAGHTISCEVYSGELPVQRACAVDARSYNDIPVLYMSFFFADGHLNQVAINIPWWSHAEAYRSLDATLGQPAAAQPLPRSGVRLYGWQLNNGSAVFFNRDRPLNPLSWNAIYWRSAWACKNKGCFGA